MHIHWHRFVKRQGLNSYYECRCSHRKVQRSKGGYSPVDKQWLQGYDWTKAPTTPPRGRGGASQ